ncbi:MAG: HU family DNA-binding protein [Bacilli bacterium]|nr:HU family DNA-binding protein [Bacilli bacterium]
MNKAELVLKVGEVAQLSKKDAEAAVNALFEAITEALVAGEEVKVTGFGGFVKKNRPAREGTNPKDQKKITIPASATVGFKVSKALKEKLN